jgi:hypothetical protein
VVGSAYRDIGSSEKPETTKDTKDHEGREGIRPRVWRVKPWTKDFCQDGVKDEGGGGKWFLFTDSLLFWAKVWEYVA